MHPSRKFYHGRKRRETENTENDTNRSLNMKVYPSLVCIAMIISPNLVRQMDRELVDMWPSKSHTATKNGDSLHGAVSSVIIFSGQYTVQSVQCMHCVVQCSMCGVWSGKIYLRSQGLSSYLIGAMKGSIRRNKLERENQFYEGLDI